MKLVKSISLSLVTISILSLTGCGGGGSDSTTANDDNNNQISSKSYIIVPKDNSDVLLAIGTEDKNNLLLLEKDSDISRTYSRSVVQKRDNSNDIKIKSILYKDLKNDGNSKIIYDNNGFPTQIIDSSGFRFDITSIGSSGFTMEMYDSNGDYVNDKFIPFKNSDNIELSPWSTSLLLNPNATLKNVDFSSLAYLTPHEIADMIADTKNALYCGAAALVAAGSTVVPVALAATVPVAVLACGNLTYSAVDNNFDLSDLGTAKIALDTTFSISGCMTGGANECKDLQQHLIQVSLDKTDSGYNTPIKELYDSMQTDNTTNPTTDLTNGLVAHYEFEGNANDSSGNGNHGTEYGGVGYVDGAINKSLNIAQEGERIEISNEIAKIDKDDTISIFFKANNLTNTYNQIFDKTGGSDFALNIKIVDGNYMLRFTVHNGSEYKTIETSISQNTLYHVVIQKNISTIKFFLNGTLDDTINIDSVYNKNIPLIVGAGGSPYDSGYGFNGIIDDLRFYNRLLSESEIQELYNLGQ